MSSSLSSTRLMRLYELLGSGKELWDIGCDHGLIGKAALLNGSFERVSFVDPSSSVIKQLALTLGSDIPKGFFYSILKQRADQIFITQPSNTFLLAGFGGKPIIEGLQHLDSQLTETNRFVLCPHRDVFEVRRSLIEMNWSLELEEIHEESGEFYNIMVVNNAPGVPLHPFGVSQWKSTAGKAYCQHLLDVLAHHRSVDDQRLRDYLLSL